MRSDGVVVLAPLLDDDTCLLEAVEDFSVEALVAQLSVEGLAIAVLPRAAGLVAPSFANQPRTILAVISAPLSERMCSGT